MEGLIFQGLLWWFISESDNSHRWQRLQSYNFCREVLLPSLQESLVCQSVDILWHLEVDKPKCHVTQRTWLGKVHGGKAKERGGKKKLDVQCVGLLSSSGNICVLMVLITIYVVLHRVQHHPSEVEQVWAKHLGWRNSSISDVPPLCYGDVLLCQRALDSQGWLVSSHSPPASLLCSCSLSAVWFCWAWGSDVKNKLLTWILSV